MLRPMAETMPDVTVPPSPNRLPTATTASETRRLPVVDRVATGR